MFNNTHNIKNKIKKIKYANENKIKKLIRRRILILMRILTFENDQKK
jgi:hypothetical protein